ncbi:MAG TPA: hypothetical protein DD640_02065 [Clostridiales bacterium]|nr:hypothetical protein [Clostridiales bacterium]
MLMLISLMVLTILGSLVQFANDKQRGKVVREPAALTTTMESPKPAVPVNRDAGQSRAAGTDTGPDQPESNGQAKIGPF